MGHQLLQCTFQEQGVFLLQHSQCFIALSAPSFSLSLLFPVVAPPVSHPPMPAPKDEPDWDTAPSRRSPVPGAMAFREHPYKEAQARFTTQVLSHRAPQVEVAPAWEISA